MAHFDTCVELVAYSPKKVAKTACGTEFEQKYGLKISSRKSFVKYKFFI